MLDELPDAAAAWRAWQEVQEIYRAKGHSAGMAAFIALTSWSGEFTDEYFAAGPPDPARFGREPVLFPNHHDGFAGDEFGYPGDPAASAARLRTVLDGG